MTKRECEIKAHETFIEMHKQKLNVSSNAELKTLCFSILIALKELEVLTSSNNVNDKEELNADICIKRLKRLSTIN